MFTVHFLLTISSTFAAATKADEQKAIITKADEQKAIITKADEEKAVTRLLERIRFGTFDTPKTRIQAIEVDAEKRTLQHVAILYYTKKRSLDAVATADSAKVLGISERRLWVLLKNVHLCSEGRTVHYKRVRVGFDIPEPAAKRSQH